MKKILIILTMICALFMFSACGNKDVLSDSKMVSKLQEEGFNVNDITSSMEDSSIKVVRTANNGKYQFEYYIFKSEENAKNAYKNNSDLFKENKDFKGSEKHGDNYDEYVQETDDYYNKVVRVDKTLVYVSVNIDYKNNINKVLNKLGF